MYSCSQHQADRLWKHSASVSLVVCVYVRACACVASVRHRLCGEPLKWLTTMTKRPSHSSPICVCVHRNHTRTNYISTSARNYFVHQKTVFCGELPFCFCTELLFFASQKFCFLQGTTFCARHRRMNLSWKTRSCVSCSALYGCSAGVSGDNRRC